MNFRLLILTFLLFPFWGIAQENSDLQSIQKNEIASRKSAFHFQSSSSGANFNVKHYRCEWKIDPRVRYINGMVRTTFQITSDTATQLVFDFYNGLTVDSVKFRGAKRTFGFQGTNLFWYKTGVTLNLNTNDSVSIYYHGVPANSGFGAFNKQNHAGVPIIWTMSCPYAARDWWPCKQDLIDKPDSVDLFITTPQQYRAAGNGLLVSELQSDTFKTYHWKHKYPIATYLVATAVTNYMAFTHKVHLPSQAPGDSMPVVNFVYPETATSAFTNTKNVLKLLQYYDSLVAPYPFRKEKYGHAQFGWGGGMEHQTMSFMTDFSFGLQAHELAHQWFGDHITCASWRDVWLNEGWATYMAALADQRFGQATLVSWLNSSQNQVKANAGGSVWVSDTSNINRVFDSRLTYTKGALVLHMLRWTIGDEAFWNGVRNYQADSQLSYGFSNTNQFISHLEQTSGKNLSGFMADWFTGEGYPTYQVKLVRDGFNMELTLGQTTSHTSVPFFEMKVPIRFRATGFDTTLVFQHDSSGQVFHFTLPFTPITVTFDSDKWLIAKNTVQLLTSVEDRATSPIRVSAYPNPFRNSLQFLNDTGKQIVVQVLNSLGQMVDSHRTDSNFDQNISTSNLKPGVYLFRCVQGDKVFSIKMAKE